jgi:hypothetical protein
MLTFYAHAPCTDKFGSQHGKAFLLTYARGLRVAVMTANLHGRDWSRRTNAAWAQDFPWKGPASPPTSDFEQGGLRWAGLGVGWLGKLESLKVGAGAAAAAAAAGHGLRAAQAAAQPARPSVSC